jgi:phosphate transport system permease protein
MTDMTGTDVIDYTVHRSDAAKQRLARRYASERRFRALGLGAVLTAMAALVLLLATVFIQGIPAFTQFNAALPLDLSAANLDRADLAKSNFRAITTKALDTAMPFAQSRAEKRVARSLLSQSADVLVREAVLADPSLVGGTRTIALPVSDTVDLYLKGMVTDRDDLPVSGAAQPSAQSGEVTVSLAPDVLAGIRIAAPAGVSPGPDGSVALGANAASHLLYVHGGVVKITAVSEVEARGEVIVPLASAAPAEAGAWRLTRLPPESARQITDQEVAYADHLRESGVVGRDFNWIFFTRGASREAEMAGILGAVVGSVLTLTVTLALSFPLGVAAAVYLEEFAPKNRWTDLIEVNINNLAAVPSIVFGLLGLAVFLNFFGMPRSAPLVGGMVLALITLPTIIIASRAALKAVPPSIREAALGVGASKLQTVFHHVLPLALPGVMTGRLSAWPMLWGNSSAPDDRHGGLHRRHSERLPGLRHHSAGADLHVGRLPGNSLPAEDQRRDHRAADLPGPDECGRGVVAPALRASVVSSGDQDG